MQGRRCQEMHEHKKERRKERKKNIRTRLEKMKDNKTETKITYTDPNLLPSHVEAPIVTWI